MNKLEFKRRESDARKFEIDSLSQIWEKGGLSEQYTPDPISEYRLEAAYLDAKGKNLSVIFLIEYNDITNIEVAISTPDGNFDYGGQIPLWVDDGPVTLEFLDPIIEDLSMNGFRVISTMGEGERVNWTVNAMSGLYERER